MTRAEAFSEREVAMCTVARMVENGRTYWAAGGGTPLYSVLLGKKLYAPDAQYVTEDGVVAPEPLLPFEPMMTMVASRAVHRALSWGTMNSAGLHAQLGHMDYGVLNTLQVDQHGNINSTVLGEIWPGRTALWRSRWGGYNRSLLLADDPDHGPGEAQVRAPGGLHLLAGVPRW
jgi:glutaconate CoA-transferase, subunit B